MWCDDLYFYIFYSGIDNPCGAWHHGQPPGPLHLQPLPQQRHLGGSGPGLFWQASDTWAGHRVFHYYRFSFSNVQMSDRYLVNDEILILPNIVKSQMILSSVIFGRPCVEYCDQSETIIFLFWPDSCWERERMARRRIKWMTTSRGCDWSTSIFRECELICEITQAVSRQIVSAPLPPPIVWWELTDFYQNNFWLRQELEKSRPSVTVKSCLKQSIFIFLGQWALLESNQSTKRAFREHS